MVDPGYEILRKVPLDLGWPHGWPRIESRDITTVLRQLFPVNGSGWAGDPVMDNVLDSLNGLPPVDVGALSEAQVTTVKVGDNASFVIGDLAVGADASECALCMVAVAPIASPAVAAWVTVHIMIGIAAVAL